MAKLGENLERSTRVWRLLSKRPKRKWERFQVQNQAEQALWRRWWDSEQSARWKIEEHNLSPAGAEPPTESAAEEPPAAT